jgi:biopolymer transport protein ExbB/TolQ
MKKNLLFRKKTFIGSVLIFALTVGTLFAQTQYKIHIPDINREVHNNWLGIPKKVDYTVRWEVLGKEEGQEDFVRKSYHDLQKYKVYMSLADSTFTGARSYPAEDKDYLVFRDMEISEKYYFKVEGITTQNEVVQSEAVWIVTGKAGQAEVATKKKDEVEDGTVLYLLKVLVPWPFNNIPWFYVDVYESSTRFGKFAFDIIRWFLLIGVWIWGYGCIRFLHFSRVFPMKRFNKVYLRDILFLKTFGFNRSWEKRISPKFCFIIEAWKRLMKKSSDAIKETADAREASAQAYEYWKNKGVRSIEILESLINYNLDKDGDGKVKDELEKKLKKYFSGLDGKDLIMNSEYGNFTIKWQEVEAHLFDKKSKTLFKDHATVKIISAGLANHKVNGYKWLETSDEVDRAIENRATSEIERLKRNALLDWLWNLGATAPLLGLFGTVTGISVAFRELKGLPPGTTHLEIINRLSGGIFEALWTTILGLIAGIVLIQLYYYYKNKLDWIYSKWEQIYVHISEKL